MWNEWLEPDEVRPVCFGCEDKEDKLSRSAEYLENIVKMLYSKKPLNVIDLEAELDGLCYLLDVKTIPDDLQIERKKEIKVLHAFPAAEYVAEAKILTK